MNALQISQFIISYVHTHGEKEACISPVNHLVCSKLYKIREFWVSVNDKPMHLIFEFMFLRFLEWNVVFGKAGLSLSVLKQYKSDHGA